VPNKDALPNELANSTDKGDMVLVLGAGDIRSVAEELAGIFARKRGKENK
jgi:UDP-N-acetylmuramate-alanine ligase